MGKRPYLNETLNKLKQDKFNEILALEKNEVNKFITVNANYIKAITNLTEAQWSSCREDITYFIKALKNIDTLKVSNPTVYNKLCECKTKNEVMNLLESVSDLPFGNAHNIARYIIKIVKDEKSEAESILPPETNNTENSSDGDPDESVENTTNETLTLDKLKLLVESDQALFEKLLTFTDSEIHGRLTSEFYNEYGISAALIDKYIKEVIRKYPQPEMSSKKEIGEIFLIKKELAEQIIFLENELANYKDKLFSLENDNEKLKIRLEDALAKLQKYNSASLTKAEDSLFSFNLNDLSCFINNSTTDIQVNIRKALMIKACEYVDALNLLKTKNILTTEQNLPSEIIQIILLELFHEKNLL